MIPLLGVGVKPLPYAVAEHRVCMYDTLSEQGRRSTPEGTKITADAHTDDDISWETSSGGGGRRMPEVGAQESMLGKLLSGCFH